MKKRICRLLSALITASFLMAIVPSMNTFTSKATEIDNDPNASKDNILMSDNMSSVVSGWSVTGVTEDVYIHDHQSTVSPADEGHFLFGATEKGASTANAYRPTKVFDGSWALELVMDVKKLQAPKNTDALSGFAIEIIDNLRYEYSFSLHSLRKDGSAQISLKSSKGIVSKQISIPRGLHNWNFFYDDEGKTLAIYIDNKKTVQFDQIDLPKNLKSNRIALMNSMDNVSSGVNLVSVDSIKLYKQHDILSSLISPSTSAQHFDMNVRLFTEDDKDYTSGKLKIDVLIENNNGQKKELSYPVTSKNMQLTAENINVTGAASIHLSLTHDDYVVARKSIPYYLYHHVYNVACDESFSASKGAALFDDFKTLAATDPKTGWAISQYRYSNSTEEKTMIETNGEASEIEIPVTLSGNFGVYIGYVNGSNALKAKLNGEEKEVVLCNSFIQAENLYSNNVISETFVMAANCKNSKLTIYPEKGKNLRIAYIKLVPYTAAEMKLYQTPNANSNRFMIDNDGFSDFYMGLFSDEASLRYNAMEKLATQAGIGELVWCAGTSGMLNYNSPTIWSLFDGQSADKTPENLFDVRDSEGNRKPYDFQLRKGDRRAREDILNFQSKDPMHNNPATWPISILADEGLKNDVKVTASFRMRTFYFESDYIILNGQIFYRPVTLSYEDPNFLNYIKSLIVELGSAPNVNSVFLDFGRYPTVFPANKDEAGNPTNQNLTIKEKSQIVTDMLKELRSKLPNKKIYARILIDNNNLENGLDYELWVREKLIDRLITTVRVYESFYDFKPYLKLCHDNGVEYYLGIAAHQSGSDLTAEDEKLMEKGLFHPNNKFLSIQQYLERTYEGYQAGVDGIYLFNTLTDMQFSKNINPKFRYLGDTVLMKKWHEFEVRAEYINDSIEITKQGESDIDNEYTGLGSLTTTVSPIVPMFNPKIHEYTLSVPYYFDSLDLCTSAFVKGAATKVSVNGKQVNPTDQTYKVLLNLGENPIQIQVTSASGAKTSTYQIKAVRKKTANPNQMIDERSYGSLYPIVHGNTDGSFAPDKALSYAEAMQMVANIVKHDGVKPTSQVEWSGKWYANAMGTLDALKLLDGIKTERPNNSISRAEFTAIIARMLKLEKVSGNGNFTDIAGHRFENEIAALNEAKYIMGFADGEFKPDAHLTRSEACVILCRILSRSASSEAMQVYTDVPTTHWAAPFIQSASGK